jgi:Outer membrane protein beta-barrel domain
MKQTIVFFVVVFSFIVRNAEAQIVDTLRWSMEGNVGIESANFFYQNSDPKWDAVTLKQNQVVQSGLGSSVGCLASRKLNQKWWLSTGASWTSKRERYNADSLPNMLSMRNDYQWMSVPLMLKYQVNQNEDRNFFIQGGVYWNAMFHASRTYQALGMNQSQTVDISEGLQRSSLSAQLRLGWQWALPAHWYGGVFIQGNYFVQPLGAQEAWSVHPWGCGLGISLGKKK